MKISLENITQEELNQMTNLTETHDSPMSLTCSASQFMTSVLCRCDSSPTDGNNWKNPELTTEAYK